LRERVRLFGKRAVKDGRLEISADQPVFFIELER